MDDSRYKDKYRIASTRLPGYDYGQSGMYFITICTKDRKPYFGTIEEPEGNWDSALLRTSVLGEKAADYWNSIPEFAPFVSLDAFVLMPDHLHGLLLFHKEEVTPTSAPPQTYITTNRFGPQSQNLASVLRGFKSVVTTYARHHEIEFQWQARFHDRIVRNPSELTRIQNYILTNPNRWQHEYDNSEGLYR